MLTAHARRIIADALPTHTLPLTTSISQSIGARCFHSRPASCAATTPASLPPPLSPSRTALLFPGQGSQRCGSVVKQLESEWPHIVQPVWEEMDEALQMRLSRTMKDGLMSELSATELAQPAILAHSYALWRVLSTTLGLPTSAADPLGVSSFARVCMGHSLGEYTALTVAGSLPLAQAVKLVHARGLAMKHASPRGRGGMLALLGPADATLDPKQIEQLVAEVAAQAEAVSSIANYNARHQIVVSGAMPALDLLKERIKTGAASRNDPLTRGIVRTIALDVSGPFHCALMRPAAASLEAALKPLTLRPPAVPIVFNVTGEPAAASTTSDATKEFNVKQLLVDQLTSPVRWHQSILHCLNRLQVEQFVELGPSTPLTPLLRATAKAQEQWQHARATPVSTPEEMRAIIAQQTQTIATEV